MRVTCAYILVMHAAWSVRTRLGLALQCLLMVRAHWPMSISGPLTVAKSLL